MKWNRFIVSQASSSRELSPFSHLDSSRRSSQAHRPQPFSLKSCHKAPLPAPSPPKDLSLSQHNRLNDSAIHKMISQISVQGDPLPPPEDDRRNLKTSQGSLPPLRGDELQKLAEVFFRELEHFLDEFFVKYEQLRINRYHSTTFRKNLSERFEDNLARYLEANEARVFRLDSPLKKLPVHLNGSSADRNDRKGNRVIQFKNQKICEKNGLSEEQPSKNEGTLPLNSSRKDKFERSRSRRHKRERSLDSSAEDIIERSFNESYRSSRSRLKAKEALYQFSKVLNQNAD